MDAKKEKELIEQFDGYKTIPIGAAGPIFIGVLVLAWWLTKVVFV